MQVKLINENVIMLWLGEGGLQEYTALNVNFLSCAKATSNKSELQKRNSFS